MKSKYRAHPADSEPPGQPENKQAALSRRIQPFIVPLLLVFCAIFYYFGEIVDWAKWDSLRLEFFYSVHDAHRLLFLAPIIYAGYTARVKGTLIVTLISFVIFLPRAFFISPFPDPMLRMTMFTVFAGAIGCLVGIVRDHAEQVEQLKDLMRDERDLLLNVVDTMSEGVVIIGPDYKIRAMNLVMVKYFGEGTGLLCYEHLHKRSTPCPETCNLSKAIENGEIHKWEYRFPDGKTFEITSAPYLDIEGVLCQVSIFKRIEGKPGA
jgi:PAS domain-containing protein